MVSTIIYHEGEEKTYRVSFRKNSIRDGNFSEFVATLDDPNNFLFDKAEWDDGSVHIWNGASYVNVDLGAAILDEIENE